MKCVNHLEKDATVVCNHCGKSLCPDCFAQIEGQNYCKDCLAIKQGGVKKEERSAVLAAILSFVISGLGQIYNGQIGKGLLIFFTSWLIIPWVIGIIDAYQTASKINRGEKTFKKRTGCLIAFVATIVVFWISVFFLMLLAAIAIPNLLRARMTANEQAAEATLKNISEGIESYAVKNSGKYPVDESELVNAQPAYLYQTYDKRSVNGYLFSEELRPDGYKVSAAPKECNVTGGKNIVIQTGGNLTSEACKEEGEK